MTYLIDTNIIIFALKDPRREVSRRLAAVSSEELVLSSIVEAELYHGAEKYAIPAQRRESLFWFLEEYVRVPFDTDCVPHYASLRHHLEKRGQLIGGNDLMIAATALAYGLTVITHNSAEFSRVPGLKSEDWA